MSSTADTLSQREKSVLVAAYSFLSANTAHSAFDAGDIRSLLQPAIPEGFLKPTLQSLANAKLLTRYTSNFGVENFEFTGSGLAAAETFNALGPQTVAAQAVPAADRFVARSDNEAAFVEAEKELTALVEAVRGANDLFADADERLAVERELEGIQRLLSGPKARAAAVWDAVTANGVVRWLADHAAGGVVAAAAVAAAAALARIVGLPLPW